MRVSSAGFDLALAMTCRSATTPLSSRGPTRPATPSRTEEVTSRCSRAARTRSSLRPGWNLVSFPGDPVDTAIDSVLPADHPATEVLKYEAGLWIAAVREAGQPWEGELTDIDGQSAYWINTTSTGPRGGADPAGHRLGVPPAGHLAHRGLEPDSGDRLGPGEAGTAQPNYFSSLSDGRLRRGLHLRRGPAVGKSGLGSRWTDGQNGQGVWVYSRSNVSLVP